MDVARIVRELRQGHESSRIIRNRPDGRRITELVREDAASGPQSTATAVIERSPQHHHLTMTESYRIIKGHLLLHLDAESVVLGPGDTQVIKPGVVHWGEADPKNPAWVEIICNPPFSSEEFVLD